MSLVVATIGAGMLLHQCQRSRHVDGYSSMSSVEVAFECVYSSQVEAQTERGLKAVRAGNALFYLLFSEGANEVEGSGIKGSQRVRGCMQERQPFTCVLDR